jgi:hypothetical protein
LVSALEPVLVRRGGTWVGWSGASEGNSQLPPNDAPYNMVACRFLGPR